jgi:hypothetical protein
MSLREGESSVVPGVETNAISRRGHLTHLDDIQSSVEIAHSDRIPIAERIIQTLKIVVIICLL